MQTDMAKISESVVVMWLRTNEKVLKPMKNFIMRYHEPVEKQNFCNSYTLILQRKLF